LQRGAGLTPEAAAHPPGRKICAAARRFAAIIARGAAFVIGGEKNPRLGESYKIFAGFSQLCSPAGVFNGGKNLYTKYQRVFRRNLEEV
jgi:hypothetical protein